MAKKRNFLGRAASKGFKASRVVNNFSYYLAPIEYVKHTGRAFLTGRAGRVGKKLLPGRRSGGGGFL